MADREYQPLTGDPELLAQKARHYQSIADAITRSTTTLKRISTLDDMKSEATEALRKTAEDVGADIDKARDRYADTAQALLTYSSALREAQAAANRAIADIAARQEDAERAQVAAHRADSDVRDAAHSTDPSVDTDAVAAAARRAHSGVEDANAAVRAAQQRWYAALHDKTSAAQTARSAISDVVDRNNNGLANPSWWEQALSAIHDVLKVICDIAGVLAIFLAWVPILGQVLIVLAAVGAILDVIDAIVAVINGTGDGWGVLFAVGSAVVTLFGGKILAFAAKELRASAVINSGLQSSRSLARLQGVGAHSKDLMSHADAAKQIGKPLHEVFSSPFVRSASQKAALEAYQTGQKTGMQLVREAAKEAFPGFSFNPEKALGINNDLKLYLQMAAGHPELITTDMKVLGAMATSYQSISSAQKIINLPTKLTDDPIGVLLGGSEGEWKTVYDGANSVYDYIQKRVGAGAQ